MYLHKNRNINIFYQVSQKILHLESCVANVTKKYLRIILKK